MASSSLRRLELWDVPAEEIEELERSGKPHEYLTLRSPLTGIVLEKDVFAGQYVTAQSKLYVVADLSTVWVQAKVYEYELPHVELGQPASVTLPGLPEQEFAGKIVFIEPTVDETTRTVQVRVELPNEKGLFKPGMFAHIAIEHAMGDGLLAPASAILRTGERDIAFRAEEDRFTPVEVKISEWKYGDRFHVVKGLNEGDEVATSANFLIDSESRLRAGGGQMPGMAGMEMGDKKGGSQSKSKKDDKGMKDMKGMKGMKM
jgi:Cu(I)/Ag(I) efflux system membrane fusion protein